MSNIATEKYKTSAKDATENPVLQYALKGLQDRLGRMTAKAYEELPEGPGLRKRAHDIRMRDILQLPRLLEQFAEKFRANGGNVYFAVDAADAVAYCLEVARRNNVRTVVKGKSMVTEEIGLNPALEAEGIEAYETDLGEYIVQLAGESPSHIIAPAVHKTRKDIGLLFADKLGAEYTEDPQTLTRQARGALRDKFLQADMGLSGCNLACAETGHITVLSNEGNIRMATTLPKIHMAFMGMERIVAHLADLDPLLRVLCRGASAQKMSVYASTLGGPAAVDDVDGPQERHVVIIDNGRSRILADPEFREMLCCIRCAACLNVCPVYGKIGGHAYGYAYSGPVGAVVTPLLVGINRAKDLCEGETLCGACKDACSVSIDIPRMLIALRERLAYGDSVWQVTPKNRMEHWAYRIWSSVLQNRSIYELAMAASRLGQRLLTGKNGMIDRLPWPLNGWTRHRQLRPIAAEPFSRRWKRLEEKMTTDQAGKQGKQP